MNPKHVREERSKDKMQPPPPVDAMSDQEAVERKPVIGNIPLLIFFLSFIPKDPFHSDFFQWKKAS